LRMLGVSVGLVGLLTVGAVPRLQRQAQLAETVREAPTSVPAVSVVSPRSAAAASDVVLPGNIQAIDIGVQRAQLEHAIATLIGTSASVILHSHSPTDRRAATPPLVIAMIERSDLPAMLFLLALATGANIDNVITVVGNPQDMIILVRS